MAKRVSTASSAAGPPSKRRRVTASASPDPLLIAGQAADGSAAASGSKTPADAVKTPSVRSRKSANGATNGSSTRRKSSVEVVIPRSSGRVGRPSRRALEGEETAPRKRSRSNGGSSSPASKDRARPAPAEVVPESEDDEEDSDEDDEAEYHALPSRSQFLSNETMRRSREARNFNWQGDVNEPRSLRGGKVVQTPTKGKERAQDDDEEPSGLVANGSPSGGLMTPSKRLRNGTGAAGSPSKRNGNGMAPSPLRRSVVARPVEEAVEGTDEDVDVDMDASEKEAEVSLDQQAADQAVIQELLERTPALVNGEEAPAVRVSPGADDDSTRVDHLQNIIARLSRAPPVYPSPPITLPVPEAENEGLQGILNLLRGTVERGEGNSCLVLGAKGCGKTRTIDRALTLLREGIADQASQPIVIRLDGLIQLNDALAIKEMGRQIAESEGAAMPDDGDAAEDALDAFPPTTLPAHLLAHLTAPSPRAVIVVMESFDLFMDHARQALLYCLLDVVQGVRTGPVEQTGRGVAVVGVTSKVNAHFKLEKRVKSRFSQRTIRVTSPLAGTSAHEGCWRDVLRPLVIGPGEEDKAWIKEVDDVLAAPAVTTAITRLTGLTADVRVLLRPFVDVMYRLIEDKDATLNEELLLGAIKRQIILSEWGDNFEKLRALSHPALVILIIAKTFAFAGRDEINFAMVEAEYQRIHKTDMAGKGKHAWAAGVLQAAWRHLISVGVLIYASRNRPPSNPYMHQFIMCRCVLSKTDILNFFKGETGGTQIVSLGSEWMTLAKRAGGNL